MSTERKGDDRGSGLVRTAKEPRREAARQEAAPAPEVSGLSPAELVKTGVREIAGLTGKEVIGVTSIKAAEGGWLVDVEAVEDRRIPSSSDLLAVYQVQLTTDGTLIGYHRKSRYMRGRGDDGAGS